MNQKLTPIEYACAATDTMMRKYPASDLPPKGHFHYHQGVFLSGVQKTYDLTGKSTYLQYAADWIRSVFSPDGKIKNYNHGNLDDIQPGILLYPLYDATSDNFYRICIENVMNEVKDIPRCKCGGFYHTVDSTQQMWLDGLYMACPFIAEYGRRFERPDLIDLAVREIELMRDNTIDSKSGLWYHAYDESRKAAWCDPETGHSSEFWGRSISWVPVGILDVMQQMDPSSDAYSELGKIVTELLHTIMTYQGQDGRWFQVVDKSDKPGNWPENSCSSLFAAALSRAFRIGILDHDALNCAIKAFNGVTDSLEWDGENLLIGNVCIGTGVGDYQFYCNRPCSVNDLHGVGAFLLMCTELQQALNAG